jgi:hypothetical protein
MIKLRYSLVVIFVLSFLFSHQVLAATTAQRLAGRILLQVESHGEAWYVNPKDYKRYYLGKPDDAYALMKKLSLGISEQEFASWGKGAPAWAVGGLFIRPQSHGEAYYVDFNQRWNYLGRPLDAWLLFRAKGLGITNSDLNTIPVATIVGAVSSNQIIADATADHSTNLLWRFKSKDYSYLLALKSSLYSTYTNALKTFYYTGSIEPADAREKFYAIFFNKKTGDSAVSTLINYANNQATANAWTSDQKIEFLMSLVQNIPYDHAKLNDSPLQPNYPYETLYKNSGICSDKTFLAVSILRELGYGAAILDFPDINHSAAGISCPLADSLNNSGYCFVETTNFFQIGVIPSSVAGGQAVLTADSLTGLFDSSRLSRMEIYQKTSGQIYYGLAGTKKLVSDLQTQKAWIDSEKIKIEQKNTELTASQNTLISQRQQLDAYQASGDVSSYNSLVGTYNAGVNSYNAALEAYRVQLNAFNQVINEYNDGLKYFYQQ